MALEGTLKDFSLADIFQLIGLQRKTGILTLQSEIDTVTVTFLDGKIVGAESVEKKLEDRLGRVLVKRGYIDESQLEDALQTQRETLQRLGYILIKNNVISPEELKKALHDQINQIIFRLFRWKEGYYHFRQEKTVHYDKENIVPMSAENILMAGVQIVDEWPRIEKRIPNFDLVPLKKELPPGVKIVTKTEDDEADFTLLEEAIEEIEEVVEEADSGDNVITLSHEEELAYALVDGERSVQAIIDACHQGEFETLKALYTLLTAELIEFAEDEAVLEQVEETESKSFEMVKNILVYAAVLLVLGGGLLFLPFNPLQAVSNLVSSLNTLFNPSVKAAPHILINANKLSFDHVQFAIHLYFLNHKAFPKNLETLVDEQYVSPHELTDVWGNQLEYEVRDQSCSLRSLGPDGIAKTTDDIIVETHSSDLLNESVFFPSV